MILQHSTKRLVRTISILAKMRIDLGEFFVPNRKRQPEVSGNPTESFPKR